MCSGMNHKRIEQIREEQQIELLKKKIHPDAIEMVKRHSMDQLSSSQKREEVEKHGN